MAQFNKDQYADAIVEAIGVMSVEDKPALVDILKRNGSMITEMSTEDEILDASFKALKDSKNFRKDLQDYLVDALGSVDDGTTNFSNKGGVGWGKFKTALGNFGKSVFSQENISTAVGLGMTYASTRLNANAQRGTNQQAIDFEKAKAETAMAEAKKLETEGLLAQVLGQKTAGEVKKKKWILPVVIVGGVAVVGTILYFVLRKRN
jgi:hypothetical protein